MDRDKLTFEELSNIARKLRGLEYAAKHISSRGDLRFCANHVFYSVFKPLICDIVGWRANWVVPSEPRALFESLDTLLAEDEGDEVKKDKLYCEPIEKELLCSMEAYDVVYDHIYNLLPSCRDCGCRRFMDVWNVKSKASDE